MSLMFAQATSLQELILGEHFSFDSDASLPNIPITAVFTGYWQNVGTGIIDNPQGEHVFTSVELMANFNGATIDLSDN